MTVRTILATLLFTFQLPLVAEEKAKSDPNSYILRKAELEKSLEGADKLEILSVEFLKENKPKVLATMLGEKKLLEFVNNIEFKKKQIGLHCCCRGSYHLHVFKKDKLVAVIGYHHHTALRWNGESWQGDSQLTNASTENILNWFTKNGFQQPFQSYTHKLKVKAIKAKSTK